VLKNRKFCVKKIRVKKTSNISSFVRKKHQKWETSRQFRKSRKTDINNLKLF